MMNRKKIYLGLLALSFIITLRAQVVHSDYRQEKYRPQYHFSPERGWIGDPCGFVYYQGKYQMFWWGKVISDDLIYYTEESPMVMTGDSGGIAYFTGSVAVDKKNTAGFGDSVMIASYTIFNKETKNQSQGISYSYDGKTFRYFDGNPVLDIGSTEFRDPTVFWHEPTSKWIMVVAMALERKIKFYSSANLKDWTWMSDFGPAGAQEKAWECPDLFELSVDGDPKSKKWVMVVSIDWAREQYFVGDFDGTSFTLNEKQDNEPLYVDHGLDYYASRVFRDYDDTLKTTTTLGWVASWDYAQLAPSSWGKGFWSIPRNYELKTFTEGIRLIQKPIDKLKALRQKLVAFESTLTKGISAIPEFKPDKNVYEIDATFSTHETNIFGFNLCVGAGRKVSFIYDTDTEELTIDRTNCSDVSIDKFPRKTSVKVIPVNQQIRMHFFVDKSSIELFTNEGKEVFTLLTYPDENQTGVEFFSKNESTTVNFQAWELKSIWK